MCGEKLEPVTYQSYSSPNIGCSFSSFSGHWATWGKENRYEIRFKKKKEEKSRKQKQYCNLIWIRCGSHVELVESQPDVWATRAIWIQQNSSVRDDTVQVGVKLYCPAKKWLQHTITNQNFPSLVRLLAGVRCTGHMRHAFNMFTQPYLNPPEGKAFALDLIIGQLILPATLSGDGHSHMLSRHASLSDELTLAKSLICEAASRAALDRKPHLQQAPAPYTYRRWRWHQVQAVADDI